MFAFWVVAYGRFDCISIHTDVFSFRKARRYECFFCVCVDSSKRHRRGAFKIPLIFEHEKVSFRRRISADRVPALIKLHSHLYVIVSALNLQSTINTRRFYAKCLHLFYGNSGFPPNRPKTTFPVQHDLKFTSIALSFFDVLHIFEEYD